MHTVIDLYIDMYRWILFKTLGIYYSVLIYMILEYDTNESILSNYNSL